MLSNEQRLEFGRRFGELLVDLLCVHQDPDTCALRARVEAVRLELKSDILSIALTPGPQGAQGDRGPAGQPGPAGAQGDRGQEAPSSDEVVGDVMSVMEAALSELRALSAKAVDVVIDDSGSTDSIDEV